MRLRKDRNQIYVTGGRANPIEWGNLLGYNSGIQGLDGANANVFLTFNLPLLDSGAGVVNLTPTINGGSPTATYTRATAAWTKLSTGLWASVATGTARSCYLGADTTVGAYGGYFAEGARTNLCLQARDLTNASWTTVNCTPAKDQAGIDGTASSASSIVATAGNATCLQTVTEAATLSAFSLFVKRITGTGTLTIQQGASTSEISGSLNSSTYTRVEIDATVLNPVIGFTIGTNGDKFAVDMCQFENGAFASSPIPTTTVAVTRNTDVLSFVLAGNISNTVGTAYAEATIEGFPSAPNPTLLGTASANGIALHLQASSGKFSIYDTVTEVPFGGVETSPISNPIKVASFWSGSLMGGSSAGSAVTTGAFIGNLGLASITVGSQGPGALLNGTIRNVRIYSRALSASQLQAMTT